MQYQRPYTRCQAHLHVVSISTGIFPSRLSFDILKSYERSGEFLLLSRGKHWRDRKSRNKCLGEPRLDSAGARCSARTGTQRAKKRVCAAVMLHKYFVLEFSKHISLYNAITGGDHHPTGHSSSLSWCEVATMQLDAHACKTQVPSKRLPFNIA